MTEAELWVPLPYINVSALTTEQQHLLLQELHPVADGNREFTGLCFKRLQWHAPSASHPKTHMSGSEP